MRRLLFFDVFGEIKFWEENDSDSDSTFQQSEKLRAEDKKRTGLSSARPCI